MKGIYKNKPSIANLGIMRFYEALINQGVHCTQIEWMPPFQQKKDIQDILNMLRLKPEIRSKIEAANQKAVSCLTESDPYWVDILPAAECIKGLGDHVILHSGPPIEFKDMVALHQRGMVNAVLFEEWAKNEKEARKLLESGEVKLDSALNYNTVGAGCGIITRSIAMLVIEDRRNNTRAVSFPTEGQYQGGFCSWGLFSPEIAENLRYMRDQLFPVFKEMLAQCGGIALKPILAESLQMGDENHTRQTAADLIFNKVVLPMLIRMNLSSEKLIKTAKYIAETPRLFHPFGQSAARAAAIAANGIEYSTMVTAMAGNGVEYGIQVAGLPGQWFTAKAPMMKGKYTSTRYSEKDQLPWMGDSCVVETAGMGGIAAAASPIVCNLRGMTLKESIAQTREAEKICIAHNCNFIIPNLDFDPLPCGIDICRVLETGISPAIHGGMFNHEGGLIGAGMARIPMMCFERAIHAYMKRYAL